MSREKDNPSITTVTAWHSLYGKRQTRTKWLPRQDKVAQFPALGIPSPNRFNDLTTGLARALMHVADDLRLFGSQRMRAVDNALTIAGDKAPEFTCSAVWGGKLSSVSETCFGYPVIWRSSAVWGSRISVMRTQPCADWRTPARLSQDPGSNTARRAC